MRRWATLRLLLVLVLFAAAIARPPGAMLSSDGDTVTYEICSGSTGVLAALPVEGDADDPENRGCDFFARQVAAVLFGAPDIELASLEYSTLPYLMVQQFLVQADSRRSNSAREPPFVS